MCHLINYIPLYAKQVVSLCCVHIDQMEHQSQGASTLIDHYYDFRRWSLVSNLEI